MTTVDFILAQPESNGWGNLLYLLLFLVLPALNSLGKWLRERHEGQPEAGSEEVTPPAGRRLRPPAPSRRVAQPLPDAPPTRASPPPPTFTPAPPPAAPPFGAPAPPSRPLPGQLAAPSGQGRPIAPPTASPATPAEPPQDSILIERTSRGVVVRRVRKEPAPPPARPPAPRRRPRPQAPPTPVAQPGVSESHAGPMPSPVADTPVLAAAVAPPKPPAVVARQVARLDHSSLRRAVALAEILGPPVGVRPTERSL